MKLIDADLFMDFIKEELKQDRPDFIHIENIIRVLEDLPIAFDVDKVLKQLSEKNRAYYERGLRYEEKGKISSALSINDRAEGIEIAYEIVKRGGINE